MMAVKRLQILFAMGLLILWGTQAAAFLPADDAQVFEIPILEAPVIMAPTLGELPAAGAAAQLMTSRYGGGWQVYVWNQASHTPQDMFGTGVQLAATPIAADRDAEALGLSFVDSNSDLLGARAADLVVERVVRGAGKVGVHMSQRYHGIPVWGGGVKELLTEGGRLFVFGSTFYNDIDVNPVPAISAADAEGIARADLPFNPATDKILEPAALLVLPVPRAGGGADYHLVWRTVVATAEPYGAWITHVDAHDGQIVWRTNDVQYAYSGTAQGAVDQSGYCQGPQTSPFRNMTINITGLGSTNTGADGSFSMAGTGGNRALSCQFNGPVINVNDTQFGDSNFNGTIQENVPLTISWSDATPSRRAERDCMYWINETNAFVKSIDPAFSIPLHQGNVNVNSTCNANWTTWSMNFFREGGGCANTGIIGDIMAHEYGHGLQYVLLGGWQGNEGLGEGNGDISGNLMTNDHVVGRGFYLNQCAGGIRDCVNSLVYPENVVGVEIHDAGRVICGFNWDAWQLLVPKLGAAPAKAHMGRLWHMGRKLYIPTTQPAQVLSYFAMDDNDGNLGNGTPNYDELCQAAANHHFSCPAITEGVTFVHTPLTDTVSPGPFAVVATITAFGPYPINASSPTLYYSTNGGAYTSTPMGNIGGNNYQGNIPAQPAGTAVAYYMTAANTNGTPGRAPAGQGTYYLFGVGQFTVALDDNFETDQGWSVTEPGLDGTWVRADPNRTAFGQISVQPEDDHTPDPGVLCWVTGNPPPGSFPWINEVDGRTSLVTPILDMSGGSLARGTFWYWAYITTPSEDHLDFSVSSDGGATWTLVKRFNAFQVSAWNQFDFAVGPFNATFTSQMRFKFSAEDGGPDSIVEGLVDDFQVRALRPGSEAVGGPAAARPVSYALAPSQPNPFNPSTEIRYELPASGQVTLTVFDVSGRELKVLVDELKGAGSYSVAWDGTDRDGRPQASGVYFYRLTAGAFEETRRMTLLK